MSQGPDIDYLPSKALSAITPDREGRRCEILAAIEEVKLDAFCTLASDTHRPNIIENERDSLLSLGSRSKSLETVRSCSEIIEVRANTPNRQDCSDYANLVSPPKLSTTASAAKSIFDSWNSPHNSEVLESPVTSELRTDVNQLVTSSNIDLLNGRIPYPPSSPMNSDLGFVFRYRDDHVHSAPSDNYQVSNLPSAFRTKSWNSESLRLPARQSLSGDLLGSDSFDVQPYRICGLGNMFSPSPVDSTPLSITKSYSYESNWQINNSRAPPMMATGPSFTRDIWNENCNQRPYTSFNKSGPISQTSFSGFRNFDDQLRVRRPPAIPTNIGHPAFYDSLSRGARDNMCRTQTFTEKLQRSQDQQVPKKTIRNHVDCPKSSTLNQSNLPKSARSMSGKVAQAAIAAGNTMPSAAHEVPFDIRHPPLTPITPPSDIPLSRSLSEMSQNDVLLGRGGGTNSQLGNQRYRTLVQQFQPIYLLSRRKDKPLIARSIVLIIRNRGGRFLRKDETDSMLYEVGDERAEGKTSQALREGLDVRANHSKLLMVNKATNNFETNAMDQRRIGTLNVARETESSLIGHQDAEVRTANIEMVTRQDPYYFNRPYHGLGKDQYYEGHGASYNASANHHDYRNVNYPPTFGPPSHSGYPISSQVYGPFVPTPYRVSSRDYPAVVSNVTTNDRCQGGESRPA